MRELYFEFERFVEQSGRRSVGSGDLAIGRVVKASLYRKRNLGVSILLDLFSPPERPKPQLQRVLRRGLPSKTNRIFFAKLSTYRQQSAGTSTCEHGTAVAAPWSLKNFAPARAHSNFRGYGNYARLINALQLVSRRTTALVARYPTCHGHVPPQNSLPTLRARVSLNPRTTFRCAFRNKVATRSSANENGCCLPANMCCRRSRSEYR